MNDVPCEECEYCGEQYFEADVLKKIEKDFMDIHFAGKRSKQLIEVPVEEFADKVKNTEELRSALFTNVMENLRKMDASPSQQQQQILQQSRGSIGTDPNAIPAVVNVYKQILIDKATQHNLQVKQAQEGPAKLKYPYDISIPIEQGQWKVKP